MKPTKLKKFLFEKQISVTDFADSLEASRNHISRIVNGNLIPSKRLAKDIERATNGEVTAEELLFPEKK